MRLDKYLSEKGLAESRQKAQRMIDEGNCLVNGTTVKKASYDVCEHDVVEIVGETLRYVGRGGLKLEGAIKAFGIDVSSLVCVDVGASTGGFTDCLLQHGASKVYAVDCGSGQLHSKLVPDPRVVNIEKFNARLLSPETLGAPVDMAVTDVSFISQTALHGAISSVLKKGGLFVTLIKPQFEAGKEHIGKGGIVKDPSVYPSVIEKVKLSCEGCGMRFVDIAESSVKGGDGNTEFVAYFIKE